MLSLNILQTFRGSITCRELGEIHFTASYIEHPYVTNLLILPPEIMVLLKNTFWSGVQNALQRYLKYNLTINFKILSVDTTLLCITRFLTPVPDNDAPFQRFYRDRRLTISLRKGREKLSVILRNCLANKEEPCILHCLLFIESLRRLQLQSSTDGHLFYYCSSKPPR